MVSLTTKSSVTILRLEPAQFFQCCSRVRCPIVSATQVEFNTMVPLTACGNSRGRHAALADLTAGCCFQSESEVLSNWRHDPDLTSKTLDAAKNSDQN